MVYITGDMHRDFKRLVYFCLENNTSKDDIMIILGDAGINYYGKDDDNKLKDFLQDLSITLFCIHGNHERRPENIESYKTKEFKGGIVYFEEEYPNILFAKDGEIYDFNDKKVLVIGGAYSVDKEYRIIRNLGWWKDEQPSNKTKEKVLDMLDKGLDVDIVLTHTCPYKYLPYEVFLEGIDQSKVDQTTEKFLDIVEEKLNYKKWYCGHFHTNKIIDKLVFMFEDVRKLDLDDSSVVSSFIDRY